MYKLYNLDYYHACYAVGQLWFFVTFLPIYGVIFLLDALFAVGILLGKCTALVGTSAISKFLSLLCDKMLCCRHVDLFTFHGQKFDHF